MQQLPMQPMLVDPSKRRPRVEDHETCDWHDILIICNTVALACIALVVVVVLVLLLVWHV